ncbi:hypothetical protein CTI12_AA065780 [Artemisia annua]|uniref:RRM domain-containing protein n=1 Tax=Artemisia annua TaxID=35608 RepID=A0A2U1Q7I6_ARTAN|nr:hypothetical protein CTI12_AA065780 [Artemisia annua]
MGSYRSKEDDVSKISTSIFVTNFPESLTAKDLFNSCKKYGHVVDSFIPLKRSKAGKRFGFIRFINVFNVERLVSNLCMIWVDRFKFHANIARFNRAPKNGGNPKHGGYDHGKKDNGVNRNDANVPCKNVGPMDNGKSFAHALLGKTTSSTADSESIPAIVLDDECLYSKDFSKSLLGRVKEFASLSNLKSALINEGFADLKIRYMGELWVMLEFNNIKSKDLFKENVGAGSWFSVLRQASNDFTPEGRIVWVEVEGIPLKFWSGNTFKRIASKWGKLLDVDDKDEMCFHSKRLCIFTKLRLNIFENFKIIFRGKVFWIRAKEVPGWTPDFLEDSDDEDQSIEGKYDQDAFVQDDRSSGDDNDVEKVSETLCDEFSGQKVVQSEDPFDIYPLLNKHNNDQSDNNHSLIYPPGFTPENESKEKEPNGDSGKSDNAGSNVGSDNVGSNVGSDNGVCMINRDEGPVLGGNDNVTESGCSDAVLV